MAEKKRGRQGRREETTHHQTVFIALRREQCPSAQDYPGNNGFRKIRPSLPSNIYSSRDRIQIEILEIFAEATHYPSLSESFVEAQGLHAQLDTFGNETQEVPNNEILRYRGQMVDEKDALSNWHHAYGHLVEGL